MECCYSCKYWDKASRKIPINVRKVVRTEESIEIIFKDRVIKIPSWIWVPNKPIGADMVRYMRFCFYGKGLIKAWDKCENYEPKYSEGKAYCEIGGKCMFRDICPKLKRFLSYIA